ncbi:MAG: hypothetical protein WCI71_16690, partial [Bacteroidota bacterium]
MANNNETAKIDVILNGQKANATLKEMEAAARQLNAELRQLPVNSKEFVNKTAEFGKGKTRIAEINNEIKNTGLSMKNMGDGLFGSLKNAALKFGAAAAAAFSLNAIKDYVKGGIESAMKLRDTESLLLEELNGQKSVQADLIKLATERSGSTKFGRLEIEEAEKFLAIQQRTPEQIKKTIVAATNLAALTGGSLNDAVKDLDGTMEGRLGKGLGKLEKDFKGLTKEQMYNGEAIDIV